MESFAMNDDDRCIGFVTMNSILWNQTFYK